MISGCIKQGFSIMGRQYRLGLLLWLWTLLSALAVTFPLFQWWNGVLATAPEADRLLEGFSSQILRELTLYDHNSLWRLTMHHTLLQLFLALLSSPLIAGGMLELVTGQGNSLTMARFAGGAGRYFWRFLRLSILGGIFLLFAVVLFLTFSIPLLSHIRDAGWEAATVVGILLQIAVLMGLMGCFTVVMDYARIAIVLEGSNRSLYNLFSSVLFVFGEAPQALLPAIFFGGLCLGAWSAGFILSVSVATPSWGSIVLATILSQLLLWIRCALRVGTLGACTAFYRGNREKMPTLGFHPTVPTAFPPKDTPVNAENPSPQEDRSQESPPHSPENLKVKG